MDCNICGAKTNEMNKLDRVVLREKDPEALQIGWSTLHAWIRTFEWVLHVGYRVPLKTWSVSCIENQAVLEERKRKIQA